MSRKSLKRPYPGIYSVDDAAVFLRATTPPPKQPLSIWERRRRRFVGPSTRHVHAWIRRSGQRTGQSERSVVLTFQDLVRAKMIVLLRSRGLKLGTILNAESYMREVTGNPQPFITEDLWSSASDVFFEFEQRIKVATRPAQLVMDDVIREYMTPIHHGLEFDSSGSSVLWRPMRGVLVDPELQFGAPCIEGTRIETEAVWSFHKAGTPTGQLAELYKVQTEEIAAAIAWEETLERAA